MKTLELEKATAPLADYARHIGKEPVVLTSKGKPVAALVLIRNADLETMTLSTHPTFLKLIEQSRAHHKVQGGVSSQEMRRRLRANRSGL